MCDSILAKESILRDHVGKSVTVVLLPGGQASVFSGTLGEEQVVKGGDASYWFVLSGRGIVNQNGTQIPIPETKIFFSADRFGHLVVAQETTEEALKKIQEEQEGKRSSLLDPKGRILQ